MTLLRGGCLSGRTGQTGLPDCTQTVLARIQDYAGTCYEPSQHQGTVSNTTLSAYTERMAEGVIW